ncbi:hypothetical protein RJ640_011633 [Escallonia rubra]|uniref:TIR domain-containing protein n=1 Tax=Escallonia rubra TaxID=112253 RepID=A0AA88UJR1_9ASTE|nr:hypothetical protein RJ640_011633 [Escallonia rubra]
MDEDDSVDKEINTRIEAAIRDSDSAIVIFSANYASCPCCLDELVLIYERCTTSTYQIIPIFYTGVTASHVRRQTHGYAKGLEGLQEKHSDKMGKWREALEQTSYIIGMHMERNLNKFLGDIVEEVRKQPVIQGKSISLVKQQDASVGMYHPAKTSSTPVVQPKTDLLSKYPYRSPPGGEDKVVLYTSSLGAIQSTSDDCKKVIAILHKHKVTKYENRDSWKDTKFKKELENLVGRLSYPRFFIKGRDIGGAIEVQNLDKNGELESILNSCLQPQGNLRRPSTPTTQNSNGPEEVGTRMMAKRPSSTTSKKAVKRRRSPSPTTLVSTEDRPIHKTSMVLLYTTADSTSLETEEMRSILNSCNVVFSERDGVKNIKELDGGMRSTALPILVVKGKFVGGIRTVRYLYTCGELIRSNLKDCPKY